MGNCNSFIAVAVGKKKKKVLFILKINYFMNGLYDTVICDGKGFNLINQEFPSSSMYLIHKVKYQEEGDSIISESGVTLQFTKIKEEKEKKCIYLTCSERLNYPDI